METRLFERLMADSHSGDYSSVIKAIVDELKKCPGAKVAVQRIDAKKANVIAIFGKPELIVNCHMDTVPPADGWSTDPTKPVEKEGKIFGLGACDTKGSILAVIEAVKEAKPKNLMLLFSTDEEFTQYKSGVEYFLESKHKEGLKYAIICEPTQLCFVNRHKGYGVFEFTTKAKAMHSSKIGPKTPDAISQAAKIALKLKAAGFNLGTIKGGIKNNMVSDSCFLTASLRGYDDASSMQKKAFRCCSGIAGAKVKMTAYLDALHPAKDFLFDAEKGFADGLCKGKVMEAGYWTEAALFEKAGIPAMVFGAGNIDQAHSADEFVEIRQLEECKRVFAYIFSRYCM